MKALFKFSSKQLSFESTHDNTYNADIVPAICTLKEEHKQKCMEASETWTIQTED
jgi:hypothetical protein